MLIRDAAVQPYDPQAEEYFARMPVKPTDAQRKSLSDFFAGLRTDGTLALFEAAWWLGAHHEGAAYLNMFSPSIAPTLDMNVYGGYTFEPLVGWTSNGTSGGMNTGVAMNAFTKYTQNSASMGVYINGGARSDNAIIGAQNGGTFDAYIIAMRATSATLRTRLNSSTSQDSPTQTNVSPNGFTSTSRAAAATYVNFRAGVSTGTVTQASGVRPTVPFGVGQLGGNTTSYCTQRVAFSYIAGGITGAQMATVNARVQAMMTAFGQA